MTKKERVQAVMRGEVPDRIPAGFWYHYGPQYSVQEMIDAHLTLLRETDMDIVKIMQDYMYPISGKITCADDWYQVRMKGTDSEEFDKMVQVIKGIRKEVGDDILLFQTMFGPFKALSIAFGDDVLMQYCEEAPEAVLAAVKNMADTLEEWTKGYLEAGADGIYYSAQFAEVGRFSEEEWEKFVKPYDLQILNVADEAEGKYNILHICGEPEFQFRTYVERYKDYPGDLINWSVKDNGYSLKKGESFFGRAVLGGMNNKGNLLRGPKEAIRKEAEEILKEFGCKGFMLGADCTIQGKGIRNDYIREAVEAAHEFPVQG